MQPTPDAYGEARTLLSEHGTLRSQADDEWRGSMPLPPEISAYFQRIGPVDVIIPGYGNPTKLPSLANLWDYQAGYRWDGRTGKPIAGWNDDWIVVASEGGDPYIFDKASGAVLFARHGEGVWRPEECFPNLAFMVSCMAILGAICRAAGKAFLDEDFFVRLAHRRAALTGIAKITGSTIGAERVLGRAGWCGKA